jgi:hypothetical protein
MYMFIINLMSLLAQGNKEIEIERVSRRFGNISVILRRRGRDSTS